VKKGKLVTPIEQLDDDKPVGRVLSRREVLALLGGAGAAVLAGTGFTRLGLSQLAGTATAIPAATGTALPACVVRPALTEGPYFVDEMLNRSDVRVEPSDGSVKQGVPLYLTFNVSLISGSACTPLEGAQVDIWHCDALGEYSDVQDQVGKKYLRGYQITDANGAAQFITIYPGWYRGRTVHIHFKIRTDPASDQGYEFTSQLFFDDNLTDQVHTQQPYASHGQRDTRNDADNIYAQSDGMLTLQLVKEKDGYAAAFDIGLDTSQPQATSDAFAGPPGGRPGAQPSTPSAGVTPTSF
jgi:protocatechuate 3,4-dioxygenase beta subunit